MTPLVGVVMAGATPEHGRSARINGMLLKGRVGARLERA